MGLLVLSHWLSLDKRQGSQQRHGRMGCMVLCRTFPTAPVQGYEPTPSVPIFLVPVPVPTSVPDTTSVITPCESFVVLTVMLNVMAYFHCQTLILIRTWIPNPMIIQYYAEHVSTVSDLDPFSIVFVQYRNLCLSPNRSPNPAIEISHKCQV